MISTSKGIVCQVLGLLRFFLWTTRRAWCAFVKEAKSISRPSHLSGKRKKGRVGCRSFKAPIYRQNCVTFLVTWQYISSQLIILGPIPGMSFPESLSITTEDDQLGLGLPQRSRHGYVFTFTVEEVRILASSALADSSCNSLDASWNQVLERYLSVYYWVCRFHYGAGSCLRQLLELIVLNGCQMVHKTRNLAYQKGVIKMRIPSCCSRLSQVCSSGRSMGGPIESW